MGRRHLVLLRHGKSDWSVDVPDHERPVGPRGLRQAGEAGDWLAAHGPTLDLAVVSTAVRARTTWDRAAARLAAPPVVRREPALYTFDADDVLEVVAGLPHDATAVVLVGHEPALGELASGWAGREVAMPTSALAWFTWEGAWGDTGAGARPELRAAGRPPAPPTSPA